MIRDGLTAGRFDLVGISAMVTMARDAAAAARIAKAANPQGLVIMGGPHPTTLPAAALSEAAVDAVAVGEGEETLVELVQRGGALDVPGLMVRDGAGGVKGGPRPMIADLDRLPFPALELLPMDDYFRHWFQLDTAEPGLRGTSVLATRGCPFRCSYCQPTLDQLFGRGVRKRSAANVVDELARRQEQFGIAGFLFADDTFIADRRWVRSFCEELRARGLGLIWGCNVRADLVDRELLTEMHAVGLRKIYIGIEVYDDARRREVFNKKLTRAHVEATVASARSLGIGTQGYFMLGAPGEGRSDVWNTVRYAWRLGIDDATINLTTPLPGTDLYERFSGQVAVAPEEMDYYRRYAFRPDRGLSESWLHRTQLTAYVGFYLHPRRLWRQAGSLLAPGGARRLASKLRRVL
jgi:anaerobic magnesium-protoporphyrin IX monomethyl ester cyclase